MSDKKHYFMISGSIMFTVGKPEEVENLMPHNVFVNAIVRHENTNFPVAKLAKAQQNLHKSFVMKLPQPEITNVHDIVIMSVSYLGEMTEEEFQAPPEEPTLETNPEPSTKNSVLEA